MTSFSKYYFEILKSCVLSVAGLSNLTPGDCKTLELLILEKTKQRVSETTLKRIYGFAYSKFNPSMFTLNTLARFCDADGWDSFTKLQQRVESSIQDDNSVDWELLKENAGKITEFTLQALKNKSGIPYPLTIKRQFINEHLGTFFRADYTATALFAPAGFGKTLALCHWVDEQLQQKGNDIILFFSSSALMNVFLSGRDLNDWMLALLGYSNEKDIAALLDVKQRKEGRFYLIVDGVDEHMFKNDQFQLVINQLVDIFSFYQSHAWFKLILTMRSATWVNYQHTIETGERTWFEGELKNASLPANVPLFSIDEIKELCLKINPAMQNFTALNMAENFNHPLYFQYYYKQHKKNFSLNDIDHVSIYELVSNFVLNKVYMGQYATDKIYLLKIIVEQMDFKANVFEVSKLKIVNQLKQYHQAYADLLSTGFLRELNHSVDYEFKTAIEFGNNDFLDYSIAKNLRLNNNDLFDIKLVNAINENFAGERKLSILKWSIIYAIKSNQHESFQLLSRVNLTSNEKSGLIIFMGELLDKQFNNLKDTEALVQYFHQPWGDELFNYLFGLEFIHPNYAKTLNTLLRFELDDKKRIMVYTALATLAITDLDMKKLEEYLKILNSFIAESFYDFPVNPLKSLEAVYQYFKYGIIYKDHFTELTHFYFNPPRDLPDTSSNDLIFLLVLHSLKISNHPLKVLRFIKALQKHYKPVTDEPTVYNYFLKRTISEQLLVTGRLDEGLEFYQQLEQLQTQYDTAFTPVMMACLSCIRVIVGLHDNAGKFINDKLDDYIDHVLTDGGYKLFKVYILAVLLQNKHIATQKKGDVYNHLYYAYLKTMSENGLRTDIFIKQDSLAN